MPIFTYYEFNYAKYVRGNASAGGGDGPPDLHDPAGPDF